MGLTEREKSVLILLEGGCKMHIAAKELIDALQKLDLVDRLMNELGVFPTAQEAAIGEDDEEEDDPCLAFFVHHEMKRFSYALTWTVCASFNNPSGESRGEPLVMMSIKLLRALDGATVMGVDYFPKAGGWVNHGQHDGGIIPEEQALAAIRSMVASLGTFKF
ncbi:MAG: hypothetical protein WC730_04125 [Patescibacteria group bacterium]|jgi:hypothetical protein